MANNKKPAAVAAAQGAPAVVLKKVKPYPFDALVESAGQKKPVSVLLITREGLLARVDKVLVHVGEYRSLEFSLPTSGSLIAVQARVLKTYDKALDPKGQRVERIAEFRFGKMTEEQSTRISDFLSAIGQKK